MPFHCLSLVLISVYAQIFLLPLQKISFNAIVVHFPLPSANIHVHLPFPPLGKEGPSGAKVGLVRCVR